MDLQLAQELELLYSRICHALGDPKRLLILYALAKHPRYVSELAEELDMPQPTVSRHLKVLRERNLVTTTREGAAVYYALADTRIIQALDLMRAILRDSLVEQARLAEFTALDAELDHK
ncbi:MAG: winged helix-turn-helix transcriptional regulator [Anaerolineae bacterium]|nr:winged helix-turn-helix transcriptional regulator [Anaerolineae bacterium]